MIYTSLKICFVDIPKTGSTSMISFLKKSFSGLFPSNTSVNPAWAQRLCPAQIMVRPTLDPFTLKSYPVRHEPLISKYSNLTSFHDYFFFTTIRHPFDRYKSFVYEILLQKIYNYPTYHFTSSPSESRFYTDSWFLHNSNFKLDIQVNVLLNHLRVIKNKGWDNVNLCQIPLHSWPQVNFLSVKTPRPYKLRILPIEEIKSWESDFKKELSYWTGIDITQNSIDHVDPIIAPIYGIKVDSRGIKTMPKEKLEEIGGTESAEIDKEFQSIFPSYDLFEKDFLQKKEDVKNQFDTIMEDHRSLIEEVYADDMILGGYM